MQSLPHALEIHSLHACAPTALLASSPPAAARRGKLLNVRDASAAQITGNAEIQNIKQILGLQVRAAVCKHWLGSVEYCAAGGLARVQHAGPAAGSVARA